MTDTYIQTYRWGWEQLECLMWSAFPSWPLIISSGMRPPLKLSSPSTKSPFPSKFGQRQTLLQQHSRCSIAACIFSKVVILLHVLQVSCGELGEVLRASVVQVIWRCKVKVLSFIFPLILYLWKNFCKPEKQTLIIQDHPHKNRKVLWGAGYGKSTRGIFVGSHQGLYTTLKHINMLSEAQYPAECK